MSPLRVAGASVLGVLLLGPRPALAASTLTELEYELASARDGDTILIEADLVGSSYDTRSCIYLNGPNVTLESDDANTRRRVPGIRIGDGVTAGLSNLEVAGVCPVDTIQIGSGGSISARVSLRVGVGATLNGEELYLGGGGSATNHVGVYVGGATANLTDIELDGVGYAALLASPWTDDDGVTHSAEVNLVNPTVHDHASYSILTWGSSERQQISLDIEGGRFYANGTTDANFASLPDLYIYKGAGVTIHGGTVFEGLGFGDDSSTWPAQAGAIYAWYSSLSVEGARFTNYRGQSEATIYVSGDGVGGSSHPVSLTDSRFTDCATAGHGGVLSVQSTEEVRISGVHADTLQANGGAFIKALNVERLTIAESTIEDFIVGGTGGAVYLYEVEDVELRHNVICRGTFLPSSDATDTNALAIYAVNANGSSSPNVLDVHHNVLMLLSGEGQDAVRVDGGALIGWQNTFDSDGVENILDLDAVHLTLVNNLATESPSASALARMLGIASYGGESGGNKYLNLDGLLGSASGDILRAFAESFYDLSLDGTIEDVYWGAYLSRDGTAEDACSWLPLPTEGSLILAAGEDYDGDGYPDDVGAYGGADAIWPDTDGDGFAYNEDCDDADASVFPGATETPYDGVDNNCAEGDLTDVDEDGYDSWEAGGDDCDDYDPNIHPGADEVPYDEVDQDCDSADLVDVDGDGAEHLVDCDDADASVYPEAEELCDGVDNNCDAVIDEGCGADDTGEPTPRALGGGCAGCAAGGPGGSLGLLGLALLALARRRT